MIAVLQILDNLYKNGRMIACKDHRLENKNIFPAYRKPG